MTDGKRPEGKGESHPNDPSKPVIRTPGGEEILQPEADEPVEVIVHVPRKDVPEFIKAAKAKGYTVETE